MDNSILLLSDSRGVYIPQNFAEDYGDIFTYEGTSNGYTYEQALSVVSKGPEEEYYWDAWNAIVDKATTDKRPGLVLYHDNDLFLCTPEFIEEHFSF